MKIVLLLRNIRFYVLLFSVFLSLLIFFIIASLVPSSFQTTRLTQAYALTAASFLYLALLIGPFCYNFKTPYNSTIIKARRAIGVSAFYFASLHYLLGFYGVLGGFPALFTLEPKYLLAISLSYTALAILFFMAATSFDFMIKKMTFRRWKLLHRLVYAASIFILIHALLIGEHFQSLNPISVTATVLIGFLMYLEGKRIIANLKSISPKNGKPS
ncbi:MAG: ferric reductase-like transmembrane domain-containing protein [Patescibacteria group bacterium]